MRAVWCDSLNGAWPAWDKFRRYGITRIYVDARENIANDPGRPRLQALIDGIHSQGFEAGIYRQPVWGGWTTAVEYAQIASRDIASAEKGTPKQIAYMHDFETHDIQWILAALRAWRKPRPSRMTDVTWEPFQGGLWGEADGSLNPEAAELLKLLEPGGPGGIVAQAYFGGMEPANLERVRADLVVRGFPDARLFTFYDGKYLPPAWDGSIFTGDRLVA